MPCTSPREMWPPPRRSSNKRWVNTPFKAEPGTRSQLIACGQCHSCLLDRAMDWTTRQVHEASLHASNLFVTVTYSDDMLPSDGSLSPRDHTNFVKRVRKHAAEHLGLPTIRLFMCGEYGNLTGRPHMHYSFFGLELPDLEPHSQSEGGVLYTSKILEDLWGKGHAPVAPFTEQTAGYIARYGLKRLSGDRRDQFNERLKAWRLAGANPEHKPQIDDSFMRPHPLTGQTFEVISEFQRMSRRPGLGIPWLEQWGKGELSGDFIVLDGHKKPVPKAYINRLEPLDQALYNHRQRKRAMEPHNVANNTERRLITRHESAKLKAAQLKRDLDAGG